MSLPEWHECNFDERDVVCLKEIEAMSRIKPAALRSYSTYRREHNLFGPMPQAVARVKNRRLWLRRDIEWWLTDPPFPGWQWHRKRLKKWKDERAARMLLSQIWPE